VIRARQVDAEGGEAVDDEREGGREILVAESIGCRRVDSDLRQLLEVRRLRGDLPPLLSPRFTQ